MRCSHCDDDAIIFLPYADRHLCEHHFVRMFDKRFRTTIRQFSMIRKDELIAVALSGGKDSCVMLKCLYDLQKDLPFEITAITIDEGIRNYRSKTLSIAKKLCKNLKVEHKILSFRGEAGKTLDSMIKKSGGLPCSYCGVVRRYLLNKGAKEAGADRIAIGHNVDDVAQTVLMNIMRNEPARIARFLNPDSREAGMVQRIRPLMKTPEKEIAVYAMINSIRIEHIECPYAHFAFRSQVRKILNDTEENYPGTKFRVLNALIDMEDALKKKYADNTHGFCKRCGEPSSSAECKFCSIVNGFRT